MAEQEKGTQDGGSRPVPDPTTLTTSQLLREIEHVKELGGEQINGIRREMGTAEKLRIEQKQDTKTAVDAALEAQEKANAKAEAATTKSIDQLADTFNTAFEGVRRELADLKERVGKIA
jgi:hypothetical protein